MKKIIFIAVIISAICLSAPFLLLLGRSVMLARIAPEEQEIIGYAAALSMLEEYEGKSKDEMMEISENFLISRTLSNSKYDAVLRFFFGRFYPSVTPTYYENIHHAAGKDLPGEIFSTSELKHTIEADIRFWQREAEISADEDVVKTYLTRAAAEQEVLDQLNSDPDPDLYDYCRLYYQVEKDYPLK